MAHGNFKHLSLGEGKRFCTTCQARRDESGGRWIVSGNKLTRRWSCAMCEQRKREIAEAKVKTFTLGERHE